MTVTQMMENARALSHDEQIILIKQLVDLVAQNELKPTKKFDPRQFRGTGAHLYDGTDAQEHVNQLRDEWDRA